MEIIHITIYTPKWSNQWNYDDDDDDVFTSQRCQNRPIHYPMGRIMQMIKDNSKLPLETICTLLSRRYFNIIQKEKCEKENQGQGDVKWISTSSFPLVSTTSTTTNLYGRLSC